MRYIFIAFIFMFFGCSVNNNSRISDIVTYNIDYKQNDAYFWDTYFEYSHHVQLETNEKSLFREITKLVVKDNRIYILCRSMRKILVFDIQGMFINSICEYGEGPEEYLSAVDMYINDDHTIDILDNIKSTINTYTLTGEFVRSKKSISASAFLRLDSSTCLFNRNNFRNQIEEPESFNFLCVKNDSVLAKSLSYIPSMAGRAFNFGEGNSLLYSYNLGLSIPYNDTLYVFDVEKMKFNPTCLFNFQVKRPNGSMSEFELQEYLNACKLGEVPSSIYCLYEMDKYIFGIFNYNRGVKHVLISTTTGETLVSSPTLNKDGIPILPIPYTDDNSDKKYIVSLLDPLFVKNQKNLKEGTFLSTINAGVEDEESNPVIIFWSKK